MKTNQIKHQGFTLIELIVVLGITSFAILAINQLFQEVTVTVRRTTQTGEILQRARAVSDQLKRDTELTQILNGTGGDDWQGRMVGPKGVDNDIAPEAPGGFLVIAQNYVRAWENEDQKLEALNLDPAATKPFIRSDQILFFVQSNKDDYTPYPALAPSTNGNFSGDNANSENAEYARIWLGHTMKLPEAGISGLSGITLSSFDLGQDSSATLYNPNEYGIELMLGRQVLLLTGRDLQNPPTSPGGVNLFKYKPHGYAIERDGAYNAADILTPSTISSGIETGTNSEIIRVENGNPANVFHESDYHLFHGVTDVAATELSNITGERNPLGSPTFAYLSDSGAKLPKMGDYKRKILGHAVVNGSGVQGDSVIFNNVRLFTSIQPTETDLRAIDVAPGHTAFANGVSDFIVEFAGDLYTAEVNPVSGDQTSHVAAAGDAEIPANNLLPSVAGNMNPDGRLDIDRQGRIMWYSAREFANHPDIPAGIGLPFDPDQPIVYPTPDAPANPDANPNDSEYFPLVYSPIPNYAPAAFVWEDAYNTNTTHASVPAVAQRTTKWPWLIRIRYRLHDERGEFEGRRVQAASNASGSTEPERGEWFEVILPVNRQP
ncbi:prepilin-type N-terminal cleavage/methylation domain-containing protein [Planctomycetota bacterium]|nr:prepilin-type N-terminal cleavage/methylation domain-containing protein [Planctomycetota bacterium]